jgi:hypothetical protein
MDLCRMTVKTLTLQEFDRIIGRRPMEPVSWLRDISYFATEDEAYAGVVSFYPEDDREFGFCLLLRGYGREHADCAIDSGDKFPTAEAAEAALKQRMHDDALERAEIRKRLRGPKPPPMQSWSTLRGWDKDGG